MTHLAIDMDGVILDFSAGIAEAMRKEYGTSFTSEDITQWELHDLLDPIIGRSWWSWLRDRDWLWSNFPAIDGAIGGMDQLRRAGHYLEIVTAKPAWATYAVWKWLGKWRPPVHRVTITEVGDNKAFATDAAILIDDRDKNCHQFVEAGREAILFTQPYNLASALRPGIVRAHGWADVVREVS